MIRIILLLCMAATLARPAFAENPLEILPPEVREATLSSYNHLQFPDEYQDKNKSEAAGALSGCFTACFKKGNVMSDNVSRQNCASFCECWTNNLMKVFGANPFIIPAGKNETSDKVGETLKSCIAQNK